MKTLNFLDNFFQEWRVYINRLFLEEKGITYECFPLPYNTLKENKIALPSFFMTYEIKKRRENPSSIIYSTKKISSLITWDIEMHFFNTFSWQNSENQEKANQEFSEWQERIFLYFEGFLCSYVFDKEKALSVFPNHEGTYTLHSEREGYLLSDVKKNLSLELTQTLLLEGRKNL